METGWVDSSSAIAACHCQHLERLLLNDRLPLGSRHFVSANFYPRRQKIDVHSAWVVGKACTL